MLSKHWKNTVITGAVDSYCLTCDTHLRTLNDVESHTAQSDHEKKLQSAPYYEKYKHDLIREISAGYFCEVCNLLFATDLEADLHVTEPSHAANLSKRLLTRSGNSVLAYNDISIDEKAWNGIIGTTCAICNVKVTDEMFSDHKKESKHILNIIQSKPELWRGKAVYRQIKNNLQCLTCNKLVQNSEKFTHCDLTEHENKYESLRVSKNYNVDANQVQPEVQDQENKKLKKNKKPAAKKTKTTAKSGQVKSDADEIEDYVVKVLGAKNYITKKDNKKWCLLCDWALDDFNEKQHVESRHHETLLKLHKERIAKKNAAASDLVEPDSENDEPDTDDDNSDDRILDSAADFGKHGIKISYETRSASCRRCSENVDFSYDSIKNHIEQHNKNNTKKDTHVSKFDLKEKDDVKSKTLFTKQVTKKKDNTMVVQNDEIMNFAKKHELILKNNRYYCSTCNISMKSDMNELKDHVDAIGHKNRMNRKSKTPEQLIRSYAARLPMKEFIKTSNVVENLFFNDVVINDKYCISLMSFYLFTKNNNMCACQLCGLALPLNEVDMHKDIKHAEKLQDILVITSVPDEFLRQIRIGVYHCGYCNEVVESDDLDDHLDNVAHKENRTGAQSRLERYLPDIMNRRQGQIAEVMFLQMLAGMNRM